MSRILVAGGTGFIGRPLLAAAKNAGYEVVCLTRNPVAAKAKDNLGIEYEYWDGKSRKGWNHHVEGAHAIINLTGANISAGRWTRKRRAILRQSRLESGRAVSEAVLSALRPPRVVIQASAVGYYGSRGDNDLTETTQRGEGFLALLCEEWEQSSRAVESAGVRHVVVRSGLVLGASGGVLPRFLTMFRFHMGGYLGNGRQWISWIDLKDEIRALLFLLEEMNLSGIFNLTAPQPVQMREFSHVLGRTLEKPSWLSVPAFSLKLLFGEMAQETILTSQKVHPKRLVDSGFDFVCPSLERSLMDILK